MIISPTREQDRRRRVLILEIMELCLKAGMREAAETCGEISRTLAEQIKTADYSLQDKVYFFINRKV